MSLSGAAFLTAILFFGSSEGKARIDDLQLHFAGGRIEVSFELANAFDGELVERIETGLPSGFLFQFRLIRNNRRWFDNTLDTCTVEVVTIYNAVTREYLVNFKQNNKLVSSRVVRDRAELRAAMTRFERLSLFTLPGDGERKRLYVRARAALGPGTLLGIVPTTLHTDWVETPKFRPAEAGE